MQHLHGEVSGPHPQVAETFADSHHDHPEVISKKWGASFSLGSLAVGVAEVASSWGRTWSTAVDGLHNIGDAGGAAIQVLNVIAKGRISEPTRQRLRKYSHALTSASCAVGAAGASTELFSDHEVLPGAFTTPSSLGSFALSAVLAASLHVRTNQLERQGYIDIRHDHGVADLRHHVQLDLGMAGAAVAAPFLQKAGLYDAEQLLAAGIGGFGAWHFRPTKNNLRAHSGEQHAHHSGLKAKMRAVKERLTNR